MTRFPRIFLLFLLFAAAPAHAAGPTGLLNDTGQDTCYNGSALVACTAGNSGDAGIYPRQDARFGRDAAFAAGQFTKTGAGAKGFDYTRVCFNGGLEGSGTCTGALVANTTGTATGSPDTDWACTKDNVTNLIWSLQSGSGDWITYAQTTLPNATNAATRCGFSDGWRLPTRRELLSIVHNGNSNPAIDGDYFPSTASSWYWSADSSAPDPANAWIVHFGFGYTNSGNNKTNVNYVRLVRSGQ